MRNKGLIRVSALIKFMLIYSLIVNFSVATFDVPTSLFYVNDLMNMIILLGTYRRMSAKAKQSSYRVLYTIIGIFLIYSLVIFCANSYSGVQYLWGLRNNIRFFIFFFACCGCLKRKDVYDICNFLIKLLPINVIMCTIQYRQLSYTTDARVEQFLGDYIGGIFGAAQGSNRIMNVYLLFVMIWYLAAFLKKNKSFQKTAIVIAACFYIAILAELKIVFFEFALVIAILILILKRDKSVFAYIILAVGVIYAALLMWSYFDTDGAALLKSFESLVDYSSASTYGNDSGNRLTIIPMMRNALFQNSTAKHLFGVGLGNADTSTFEFLVSDIYKMYGNTRYNLFMHGMLYVETGVVGLLLYCGFYVVNFILSLKVIKRFNKNNLSPIVYAGSVFSIVAFCCIFYNTTMRNEFSAYLAFFFLAIPYIWDSTKSVGE